MKKEKLHIVIVENLEYWLTNETSDWRVKEYIVRAPSRETAIKAYQRTFDSQRENVYL